MAAGPRVLVSREVQATVPALSFGTQCAPPGQVVCSAASQTDDEFPDAEWGASFEMPQGSPAARDAAGGSAVDGLEEQRSQALGGAHTRELEAAATGAVLAGVGPCLKCTRPATCPAGSEGSLDVVGRSYVCGGCQKHFRLPEDSPSRWQVQMGGKPFGCLLCRGCFCRLDGLYLDAEAVALVGAGSPQDVLITWSSHPKGFTSGREPCSCQRKRAGGQPEAPNVSLGDLSQKVAFLAFGTHAEESPQVCGTCRRSFRCESTMKWHACRPAYLACNGDPTQILQVVPSRRRRSKGRFWRERIVIPTNNSFCHFCAKWFADKDSFICHLRTHPDGGRPRVVPHEDSFGQKAQPFCTREHTLRQEPPCMLCFQQGLYRPPCMLCCQQGLYRQALLACPQNQV